MSSVTEEAQNPPFWSIHTHSKFSVNDGLSPVEAIVARAEELGYPALGLTDHRTVAGNVRLYRACRKVGIEPLPGIELDVFPDTEYSARTDYMHLTMVAYTEAGYRNLVRVNNTAQRKFHYKPRIDFADFARMAEDGATNGLAITTGCYYGVLPQTLMRRNYKAGLQVVNALAAWFPQVYIELQNHGIDEHSDEEFDVTDDELEAACFDIAAMAGLPCVITRDSHYVTADEQHLHDALKRLIAFGDDVEAPVFPGGGYHMTDVEGLRQYFEPAHLTAGLEGLAVLASKARLRLPELEEFTLKVPEVSTVGEPQVELEEKVYKALAGLDLTRKAAYLEQLREEFQVIHDGDMAPYLLLVDMVCEFMRNAGISYHARGSASACLSLYLLGVTQIDPVRFGLRFDRFLSRNRLRPPDVDLDVEHERREEVIEFISSHWAVRNVGSTRKYSMFEEDEFNPEDEDQRGSLMVAAFSASKKKGEEKHHFNEFTKAEQADLKALAGLKLVSGPGRNAAGYIIAPDEALLAQLPLAYIASSGKFVTAYDRKDVEALGFLKLDILGLRTRTAIRVACELAQVDFDDIPENDTKTFTAIASGRNIGVFQLGRPTMNRTVKGIVPTKLEDIIAAQALGRPAALDSGATDLYLQRRRGMAPVPTRHDDIMTATADTYGVPIYQEQIMDMLTSLGMTPEELEDMLQAVKASNEYSAGAAEAIAAALPRIRDLAGARGWSEADIAFLTEALAEFDGYSFNRAHAASYGVIAYRCAWLRRNHPAAFWTGMLTAYAGLAKKKGERTKVDTYTREAQMDGVSVLGPHVNLSKVTYSLDERGNIRKGLVAITGIGEAIATELVKHAPYTSLLDLGQRVLHKTVGGAKSLALKKPLAEASGAIKLLADAGALSGLESE